MKIIPVIHCKNMERALDFYTVLLDFIILYPGTTADEPVITIANNDAEIQLSTMDGTINATLNISVHDVDLLFSKYIQRGLDTSANQNSPVHQCPLNQTWGMREFYVTDPDGHTLRFGQPI
jgi:uncharacterized glyoxalase superfamily protein PhnB